MSRNQPYVWCMNHSGAKRSFDTITDSWWSWMDLGNRKEMDCALTLWEHHVTAQHEKMSSQHRPPISLISLTYEEKSGDDYWMAEFQTPSLLMKPTSLCCRRLCLQVSGLLKQWNPKSTLLCQCHLGMVWFCLFNWQVYVSIPICVESKEREIMAFSVLTPTNHCSTQYQRFFSINGYMVLALFLEPLGL